MKFLLAAVPTTFVGTAIPTIIVGTTFPTMIARTKISLVVIPTFFVRTFVPTNVVGTTAHMDSLNIGQFNHKPLSKACGKTLLGEIWQTSENAKTIMSLLYMVFKILPGFHGNIGTDKKKIVAWLLFVNCASKGF